MHSKVNHNNEFIQYLLSYKTKYNIFKTEYIQQIEITGIYSTNRNNTTSTSRVFVEDEISDPFKITTGVLQGDVLAPFLFIIVIDYVSSLSAVNYVYLTHKAIERKNPRAARSSSSVLASAPERN